MIISLIHHPLTKILVLSFHLIWIGLITSNTFLVKLIKHLVSYAVLSVIVTLFMLIKLLYLSLVRPKLIYCSCVWHPHLIKDIVSLEKIQRRATKFILNDFSSDYKSKLLRLNLFSLMLLYEYYDIIFFFKCLKSPSSSLILTIMLLPLQELLQIPNFCTLNPPQILLVISILIVSPVFGTVSLFSHWNNRLNHLSKISRLFFGTISSPTLILILHAPFISFAPLDHHALLYLYTIISHGLFDLSNKP